MISWHVLRPIKIDGDTVHRIWSLIRTKLSADFLLLTLGPPIVHCFLHPSSQQRQLSEHTPVSVISPARSRRPRFRMLDCARGAALVLMLISHALELLPGNIGPADWIYINVILLFTKAATPLFVFVFGMTMAFVYLDHVLSPEGFQAVRHRLHRRALFAFLSFEFLVIVVESADKTPAGAIVERMVYLRPGNWAEVLNFYIVVLLAGPWVLRWWKHASTVIRVLITPVLYAAGALIAAIPVPSYLFELKNIITGYPASTASTMPLDTFPVLQLSSFFLVGLALGEYLHERWEPGKPGKGLLIAGSVIPFGLLLSYLTAGDSLREYAGKMALDHYRFPPQVPYVLFGLSSVLCITLLCLWLVQVRNSTSFPIRMIELLGRHSLFTFNIQYVLIFTVYGLVLDMLHQQTVLSSYLNTLIITAACVMAAWLWEQWREVRSRAVPKVVS